MEFATQASSDQKLRSRAERLRLMRKAMSSSSATMAGREARKTVKIEDNLVSIACGGGRVLWLVGQ